MNAQKYKKNIVKRKTQLSKQFIYLLQINKIKILCIPFNFTELMREVNATADFNAKELRLCEALANFQQDFLFAGNAYLMQIKSAIALTQKERELSLSFLPLPDEIQTKSHKLKISVCLIFELLNLLGKGKNVNDLTNIYLFASMITGFSKNYILNTVQQGISFSKKHHNADIMKVNEVLRKLQMPFLLDISKKH